MSQTKQERNKALVRKALDTLFNKRDYVAAERYWSPAHIQHSAHIAPGREGLFSLIRSMPPTLKYEPGAIVADGDLVIVQAVFGARGAREPDRSGHPPDRGWCLCRTLGRRPGRGDQGAIR
jgi:predicted SnoaL-like aldol condensation-catalyzing enzyme